MAKTIRSAKLLLIGEWLEVTASKNAGLVAMSGLVIDETKNTITIQTGGSRKKLVKDQIIIKVNNKTIDGERISGRIEERIKNAFQMKW